MFMLPKNIKTFNNYFYLSVGIQNKCIEIFNINKKKRVLKILTF